MKKLLFLLGGILIVTTISGCSTKPSKQEIVNKFDDFITIFPSKDLTFLYDKEGDMTDLEEGDLGTWKISSFKYSTVEEQTETEGIYLKFDRNTRQARGIFYKEISEEENIIENNEYPIYYDNEGVHFNDANVEETLRKEVSDFKMLFEILTIDDEYLNTLKFTRHFYNSEVPLYGVDYVLPEGDSNLIELKKAYPSLSFEKNETTLEFEGVGTPWATTGNTSLYLQLDKEGNEFFISSLNYEQSDSLNNIDEDE